MLLLILLILGVIVDVALGSILTLTALDKPKTDPNRFYIAVVAGVVILNAVVFLTLYAIHYGPAL